MCDCMCVCVYMMLLFYVIAMGVSMSARGFVWSSFIVHVQFLSFFSEFLVF